MEFLTKLKVKGKDEKWWEICGFRGLETVSASLWQYYKAFTNTKDFGFKDQITRSALSIPSNIAEKNERDSYKEIANIINYAKGSAGELSTKIFIRLRLGI